MPVPDTASTCAASHTSEPDIACRMRGTIGATLRWTQAGLCSRRSVIETHKAVSDRQNERESVRD
eukprot:1899030-Rhodomonas_salina.2